jgi:hypothetical protein
MKITKSLYIIVRIHTMTMVDISSMHRQNYVLRQLQS